jgi:hypothetical protein
LIFRHSPDFAKIIRAFFRASFLPSPEQKMFMWLNVPARFAAVQSAISLNYFAGHATRPI